MWQGWETPDFLTSSLELIGQMAIPMMLITLGVAVARLEITEVKKSFLISLCKIFFGITAAILVGLIFDLQKLAISVLILQGIKLGNFFTTWCTPFCPIVYN